MIYTIYSFAWSRIEETGKVYSFEYSSKNLSKFIINGKIYENKYFAIDTNGLDDNVLLICQTYIVSEHLPLKESFHIRLKEK